MQGSFICNQNFTDDQIASLLRIAYFSNSQLYAAQQLNSYSIQDYLKDAQNYNVHYYYYFFEGTKSDYQLLNNEGMPYKEMTSGTIPGLLIFKIGNLLEPSKASLNN